jgi:hypothetical protein
MSQLASTLPVPGPQSLCRTKVNELLLAFADAEPTSSRNARSAVLLGKPARAYYADLRERND